MFEPNSRYYLIETVTYITTDGEQITYIRRRFLPRGENLPLLAEVTINQGDRLDNLAARMLGDPTAFWRIADANNTMNPEELTAEPGKTIRVTIPTV